VLSTDVNVHLDFKVDVVSWRFYGSVFKNLVDPGLDLHEVIQGVLKNRGKYGPTDLSHLKHHFTPSSTIQFSKIWDSIKNLSFFSGFSSLLVYAGCFALIYFLISRGCLTRIFSLCRGPPTVANANIPMFIPARASIRRPPPAPRAVARETPPSYNSVVLEIQKEGSPDADPRGLLAPSEGSESALLDDDCVVNGRRMNQNEFMCTIHNPHDGGCSGFHTI
jgi:hypothetical protein